MNNQINPNKSSRPSFFNSFQLNNIMPISPNSFGSLENIVIEVNSNSETQKRVVDEEGEQLDAMLKELYHYKVTLPKDSYEMFMVNSLLNLMESSLDSLFKNMILFRGILLFSKEYDELEPGSKAFLEKIREDLSEVVVIHNKCTLQEIINEISGHFFVMMMLKASLSKLDNYLNPKREDK